MPKILSEKFLKVIGIDQSIDMLMECKRKLPNVELRKCTFLKLPIEDKSCDVVVNTYAFHHNNFNEKILAIKEMDRVLKDNGKIIITDLMFLDEDSKYKYWNASTKGRREELEDEYFATVEEIREILTGSGYHVREYQLDELMWMIVGEKE